VVLKRREVSKLHPTGGFALFLSPDFIKKKKNRPPPFQKKIITFSVFGTQKVPKPPVEMKGDNL